MDKVVASKAKSLDRIIDARTWRFRVQEMRLIAALIEAGWAVVVNETQLFALDRADPAVLLVSDHVEAEITTINEYAIR